MFIFILFENELWIVYNAPGVVFGRNPQLLVLMFTFKVFQNC